MVANVVFAQPCMPFTLKVSVSLHWFLYLYTELLYERKSLGEIFSRYCIAAVSHFFGKFFAKNIFFSLYCAFFSLFVRKLWSEVQGMYDSDAAFMLNNFKSPNLDASRG